MLDEGRTSRRPRFPFGLIGALVVIASVEHQIATHKLACLGGSHWGYYVARHKAESGVKDCDILIFGDSLTKQAVAPNVIEARSGLRAYNFAEAGGQAPGSYLLLKRAIESGARPSAIVVDFFPPLMASGPIYNVQNWPFVASFGESVEMAWIAGDPRLLADLAARKVLPSLRCRESLRFNIQLGFAGTFGWLTGEILKAQGGWRANRGAEIVASRPDRNDDFEAWMRRNFPSFQCTPSNRAYIDKFLGLADRHAVPVFWVLPPYKPMLQDRCEKSGFDARHEAFIRSLQPLHPHLYVIDGRHSGYDPRVFSDPHHLGREGATTCSIDVADLLKRHRDRPASTPRWIDLPVYREPATIALHQEAGRSGPKAPEGVAAR